MCTTAELCHEHHQEQTGQKDVWCDRGAKDIRLNLDGSSLKGDLSSRSGTLKGSLCRAERQT